MPDVRSKGYVYISETTEVERDMTVMWTTVNNINKPHIIVLARGSGGGDDAVVKSIIIL